MRLREALSMVMVVGLAVPAAAKDLAASLRGNWTVDKLASGRHPFYWAGFVAMGNADTAAPR